MAAQKAAAAAADVTDSAPTGGPGKIRRALLSVSDKAGLIEIWHGKSVNEAREVLSRDDICVTNLKDKPEQLNKIGKVDEMVRNFFKAWHEDAGK